MSFIIAVSQFGGLQTHIGQLCGSKPEFQIRLCVNGFQSVFMTAYFQDFRFSPCIFFSFFAQPFA